MFEHMNVTIIAAVAKNGIIGNGNRIPWDIPEDRMYFRKVTIGHVVVMGRRTFESIGHPLDERTNVVLSRRRDYTADGCIVIHDITCVMKLFKDNKIYVIGGGEIFRAFMPFAEWLYITHIDHEFEGNIYFPKISQDSWIEVSRRKGSMDTDYPYNYYFTVYRRIK